MDCPEATERVLLVFPRGSRHDGGVAAGKGWYQAMTTILQRLNRARLIEIAVDEHVQTAVVSFDGGDQPGHRCRVLVIDNEGGTGPTRGPDQLAGIFDGPGSVHLRTARYPAAAIK